MLDPEQGLIVSSRILRGEAANKDEWDLMILDEYKNWAAFDGLSERVLALANKVVGPEDVRIQSMKKRSEMREIVGSKSMQELLLK
jgi:hypothetical protein